MKLSSESQDRLPENYQALSNYLQERRPVAKEGDAFFLIMDALRAQASRPLQEGKPYHVNLKGWSPDDCRMLLDELGENWKEIN